MRYYDIQITRPDGTPYRRYTSLPNGQNDPGALNIVLDAYVYGFATPQQLAALQIWGISEADISQANDFTNCTINVYAGFQKGLPLNNPTQAGLILTGSVYQCFGNWQGTDRTLDFVIATNGAIAAQQSNISFSWLAGASLAEAVATTLQTAFPGVKQSININPKLVLTHDEHGIYQSLPAFAQMLKPLTQSAIGGNYPGVDLVLTPDSIRVYDGSTPTTPTQLAFQDLIGQPTWIGPQTIQFMCPMRSDIVVPDYVTLPKGILGNPANPAGAPGAVVTTTASQPQARQQSVFSGTFLVSQVHHMGIFRQPDGQAWVTVFDAVAQNITPANPATVAVTQ